MPYKGKTATIYILIIGGIGVGTAFGAVLGNIGVGIALGAGVGAAIVAMQYDYRDK